MSNSTVTPSLIVRAHAGQIYPGRGIVISPSRMDFRQNNRHHIDSRDAMCLSSHSTELQLCSTICRQSNWEVALFACGVPDTHSDMTGQTNQCAGRHVEPAKLDLSLSKKKLLANYTMRLVDGGAYIKGRDEGWHCVTWTMDDIWHSIRLTDSGEKRDRRQISPKYNTWRPSANSAGEYRIFLRKGDNNSTMARTSSCIMAAYSNPRKPIGFFSSFDGMSFVFCVFFSFRPLDLFVFGGCMLGVVRVSLFFAFISILSFLQGHRDHKTVRWIDRATHLACPFAFCSSKHSSSRPAVTSESSERSRCWNEPTDLFPIPPATCLFMQTK